MKLIRRLFFFLYYLKQTDLRQLAGYINYSSSITGRSKLKLISDSVNSIFKYNISLQEYFLFKFFEIGHNERSFWAGTGFMYEYQLKMNPRSARGVLENKIEFLNYFRLYVKREFKSINELASSRDAAEKMLACPSGRLVLKGSKGQIGKEVKIVYCNNYTCDTLVAYMKECKYDLAEEYVVQHRSLMELSPSGLNTIRIITQLHDGMVYFLGARLRISVNSTVDNMAAGNLAASVDLKKGIVNGPGVYSDILKEDCTIHPVTGKEIKGFTIPFWNEVIELAKNSALHTPQNRSVGWDIAVTKDGAELIEGNHNWCKLLWQLPVKKGLKNELEKYL